MLVARLVVEKDSTLRNELYPLPQKNGAERPYYTLNRKLVCQCDSSRKQVLGDET